MAPRYWLGLAMFCVAAIFTVALGSILQHRAIAQQAVLLAQSEALAARLPLPAVRRASYSY